MPMLELTNILAASGDTDFTKVIFGVVFFLIWAVSQVISIIAKKTEEAKRKRMREQEALGRPPVMQAPPMPQRTQTAPRPQHPSSTPIPQRAPAQVRTPAPAKAPKRFPVKLPPPIPARRSQSVPAQPDQAVRTAAAPIASPIAQPMKRISSATAASVNAWMRPATLRQQFILTEIFQPPLALRDPDSACRL